MAGDDKEGLLFPRPTVSQYFSEMTAEERNVFLWTADSRPFVRGEKKISREGTVTESSV